MPDWLTGVIGTAVTGALGFLTWMATRKTNLTSRMEKLEKRIADMERRYGRASDYVEVLREHINTRRDPPAPPYPSNYFE
jgi:hypothetical protein